MSNDRRNDTFNQVKTFGFYNRTKALDDDAIVAKLLEECQRYEQYLLAEIDSRAKNFPADVVAGYHQRQTTKTSFAENVIEFANTGRNLLHPTPGLFAEYPTNEHTSTTHPKLTLAIEKYNTVQRLKQILETGTEKSETKIASFHREFSTEQCQQTLTKHNDSAGMRFVKNVGHVLTLGLFSRATKGSFAFWKSRGEITANAMNDSLNSRASNGR